MADSSRDARKSDKRNSTRRRWRAQVRFWNESFEAIAFTADLSDTGVLVETTRKLSLGTRVHIEVRVGERLYYSEAVVARRRESPSYAHSFFKPALGLRFIGLSEALQQMDEQSLPDDPQEGTPLDAAYDEVDDEPDTLTSPTAPTTPSTPTITRTVPVNPLEDVSDAPTQPNLATQTISLKDPTELRAVYERDLLAGALMLKPDRPLKLGDTLCVAIELPPPNGHIQVRGQVVSMFSDTHQVGLLLDERRQIVARIRELLETLE